jgi:hypothetical protein
VKESLKLISGVSSTVKRESGEMRDENTEILSAVEGLRRISRNVLEAVDAVNAQTGTIAEATAALLESNEKTNTVINQLEQLVSGYRLSS